MRVFVVGAMFDAEKVGVSAVPWPTSNAGVVAQAPFHCLQWTARPGQARRGFSAVASVSVGPSVDQRMSGTAHRSMTLQFDAS